MLLNVQSVYSLLSSTLRINDYVHEAKKLGYDTLGLADYQVLHGSLEFYQACIANNIKPLIGLKLSIQGYIDQNQSFPFLVYAKSYHGFKNLIVLSKMVTSPKRNDQEIWNYLSEQKLDLVYISLGKHSEIEKLLLKDNFYQAKQLLEIFQQIFGYSNVYLGIKLYPYNDIEGQVQLSFAQDNNIDCVLVQEVNTLRAEDASSLKILEAIRDNEQVDSSIFQITASHYLYSMESMKELCQDNNLMQVWQNTQLLSKELNLHIDTNQSYLPKFHSPQGMNSDQYLSQLANAALEKLGKNKQIEYRHRLDHELEIIISMGFSDYFLIVWDIIAYCRRMNIPTGPGRGSAAGSLVSYLLKITLVDPIDYNLYFERFLNPERHNMPDIDIDIADERRDEVLGYISEKYGYNQVAQIVTMGTFGAKQSVRDILRVMGADSQNLKIWSQAIPSDQNQGMTLERALKESSALQNLLDNNSYNQQIYKIAQTIEGIPRNQSTHAAAVVINDFPLQEIVPVKEREDNLLITQYTMDDIETMGLLKMDFLGLRNLTILNKIIKDIQKKQSDFNIHTIDMNDVATLEIFQKADTLGVFQFESDGIRRVLRKLKPENFEDIIAVNALYRPGPMKQIDHYIERKHGKKAIAYVHPVLEPILKSTYGIIVYQEQVMQIVVNMAGFSLGEADLLRRAISKKDVQLMEQERQHFVSASVEKGFREEEANQVFQYIEDFSNYGFNRAHAVVYSTLAFQLAYCKAHYPAAFYKAIINSGDSQKKSYEQYISEASKRLKLLAIDINRSQGIYTIEEGIRVGFSAIKGLRHDLINHILNNRSQSGPYHHFEDFLHRLPDKFLKDEYLSPLIYVGSFDSLNYNRRTLIENLPILIKSIEYSSLSYNLFEDLAPKIQFYEEYSPYEILNFEQEYLGFPLSGHPLDQFNNLFQQDQQLLPLENLKKSRQKNIKTLAFINSVKIIYTKKNQLMAFLQISDQNETLEVVVFPNIYQKYKSFINQQNIIILRGQIEIRKGRTQIIAQEFQWPQKAQKNENHSEIICFIQIDSLEKQQNNIKLLKEISNNNPGLSSIILVDNQRRTFKMDSQYNISHSYRVQNQLKEIFGNNQVVFQEK